MARYPDDVPQLFAHDCWRLLTKGANVMATNLSSNASRSSAAKLTGASLSVLLAAIGICTFRARNAAHQRQPPPIDISQRIHDDAAAVDEIAARLSRLIQCATVSHQDLEMVDWSQYKQLRAIVKEVYPLVWKHLEVQTINDHTLLLHWRGSNKKTSSLPRLFMAHYDVVPAEHAEMWKHKPFSGHIDEEGFIWGRGTLDNKGNMVILLEAVSRLLAAGFGPQVDCYFLFGHDEEVGGLEGSKLAAKHLQASGITRYDLIIDEGLMCTQNIIPGLDHARVAGIGVAEKGQMQYLLTVKSPCQADSAHASMPTSNNPVPLLARVIDAIERRKRHINLDTTVKWMREYLLPELPLAQQIILSNLWLFRGVLKRVIKNSPILASSTSTTVGFTCLFGSTKDNVIPKSAAVGLDIRIAAGETVHSTRAALLATAQTVTRDVTIESTRPSTAVNASPISNVDNDRYFTTLARVYRGMFSDRIAAEPLFAKVLVAPLQLMACTDTRHFCEMSSRIYRTSFWFLWEPEQLQGIHGVNERIHKQNLARGVGGMMELLRQVNDL